MSTVEIAGATVDVNDEGFMTNPDQWTPEIAVAIAQDEGIAELTEAHWNVINYCRANAEDGKSPTLRNISKGADVSTKEVFKLFPKGPAKKVAKISGLGKPVGCV